MSLNKLKVAIIGQGRSGRNIHANTLSGLKEHYEIVAVTDMQKERRERAEKDFGCDTHEDYKQLFARDDLDLIVNATPSQLHVPITLECLHQGYNVLCEKPLARTAKEVDSLIEASKNAGKLLAIYQQSRFNPAFIQLQQVILSGVLGRILQVDISFNGFARRWDWQTLQEKNGGNLMNTGPHPVDQALQLFGTKTEPQVTCMMDSAHGIGDAEDYVKLILQGQGAPTIDVEISSACAYPTDMYRVQGSLGGLTGTPQQLSWKYYKPEEAAAQQVTEEPLADEQGIPIYCGENLFWHEGSWQLPEEQNDVGNTMAVSYYHSLYDTLVNGAPQAVTPEQVRQQIAVMEECFRQNPQFQSRRAD